MAEGKKERKPTIPRDLGPAGTKLWREIITSGAYELRPDELALLEHACHEQDIIADLQKEVKFASPMIEGSQGQFVRNPVFDMIVQHRTLQKTLLKALELPDPEGESSAQPRGVQQRAAVQARWNKTG